MERLTVKAAAEYLSLSTGGIYDMVYGGQIAYYRIGAGRGSIRFEKADLDAYLAANKVQPSPTAKPAATLENRSRSAAPQAQGFKTLRRFGFRGLAGQSLPPDSAAASVE